MHTNKKRVGYSVSPLIAAVTGAVVGAGVAVAGAVAMTNKHNQDKVKGVIKDVKTKVDDTKTDVRDKTKKLGDIAKNTVKDLKNI
jgi:uncharacterized membrane-anchored protein YhcB (DUF1043 family)